MQRYTARLNRRPARRAWRRLGTTRRGWLHHDVNVITMACGCCQRVPVQGDIMARYFVFDLDGTVGRARLHDEAAPVTCNTLWNLLPFSGAAGHAMLSGTSIALYIDPTIVIPEENATVFVQTGDVMFTHYRERER